jgi:spermidine synthase
MGLAVLVFALPTCLMGMTFSLLAALVRERLGSIGQALGINTLGGAVAAPLFAPLLLPQMGAKWTLMAISLGYLSLIWLPPWPPGRVQAGGFRARTNAACLAVVVLILVPVARTNLVLVQPLEGGKVLEYREGVMAAVSVVTDARGDRFLKVNDRFRMGSTANPSNERRLGHIPLLLHAAPRRALFLGLGTGNTLAAATVHSGLRAEAVELLPEIVALQHYFTESTGELLSRDSVTVYVSDARRYVRASRDVYDVIVADLFHPSRDGSGALYTREHFRAVRQRLAEGGLFCQWLPLYQLDDYCLRVIVRTFLDVFPHADGYLSNLDINGPIIGLIGSAQPRTYSSSWLDKRLEDRRLQGDILKAGLTNQLTLLGLSVGSRERLQRFAGDGPLNTDDFPVITFTAPRFVYGRQLAASVNLRHLLDTPGSSTEHITSDPGLGRQLALFVEARDLFLRAEMTRAAGNMRKALDGYIAALNVSRDFDLAYTMVYLHAQGQARTDPNGAAALLQRIIALHPARADGKALLQQIRRAKLIHIQPNEPNRGRGAADE